MKLPQFSIKSLLAWTAWIALLTALVCRLELSFQFGHHALYGQDRVYFMLYLNFLDRTILEIR